MKNLNDSQIYDIIKQYVEIKERIESLYDAELYDELVDNVISNPTPIINNQGGQS